MSSEDDDTMSADEAGARDVPFRELSPGQLFAGRYEVQALLGRGGMGAVYRVHDRKLDEVVALKLLTLSTERAVDRFLREVRLARRVTHPNVARTHDLGEHDGIHFLTMEYVDGRSLDDVLEDEERLAPERAAHIAAEIAAGLEAAHAAGVVHRDLKPGNVLLARDGRVLLTDFGIARATRTDTRTHETGAIIGTPYYMAPEQVLGRPVNARCDLYALGLILFELLTGRLPFEADDPLAVAVLRVHQPPADPRSFAPVPDGLAELVLRCLAREPDGRPSSAAEVRAALAAIGGALQTPATTTPPSAPSGLSVNVFAPLSPGRRAVAVLPFVYRGEPDHDYLGEGMAEELIDVLSRTKGLRVLALGATRRFADVRDPSRIGAELGADAVVDGTVQLAHGRVRIAARLLETDSGFQRWSERFDGSFEDVFTMQEKMGRRIAESLRVEIDAAAHRRTAPQEAIELYLRARKDLRHDIVSRGSNTLAMLERCLELAPGLIPAYPAHAMAAVRAWWRETRDPGQLRGNRARESVARACRVAPDLADTHLVRAMLAVQDGHYREASMALAKALDIAPTMADAHQYLAELQIEAGRVSEGKRRAELALELDPTLLVCHLTLARIDALDGNYEAAVERIEKVTTTVGEPTAPVILARLRQALWHGDRAAAREAVSMFERMETETAALLAVVGKVALGEVAPDVVRSLLDEVPDWPGNARFTSLRLQIAAEAFCAAGATEMALDCVCRASEGVLVDVEWLRRCPVLAPLRTSSAYVDALERVERRASELWTR